MPFIPQRGGLNGLIPVQGKMIHNITSIAHQIQFGRGPLKDEDLESKPVDSGIDLDQLEWNPRECYCFRLKTDPDI